MGEGAREEKLHQFEDRPKAKETNLLYRGQHPAGHAINVR